MFTALAIGLAIGGAIYGLPVVAGIGTAGILLSLLMSDRRFS